MKKWLYGLGIGVGAVIGFLVVAVAILFFQLPGPSELKKRFSSPSAAAARQPASTPANSQAQIRPEAPGAPQVPNQTEALSQTPRVRDEVIENYIFDQSRPIANVCDHLQLAPESRFANKEMQSDFFSHLDAVIREDPRDPFAAAYQEIQDRENEINDVGYQAYHLFVLSRLVALKPEVATSSRLQGLCRLIETDIEEDRPFDRDSANFEMLGLLESAGVNPEDVGFDPNMESRLKFELTTKELKADFGWINQLMSEK